MNANQSPAIEAIRTPALAARYLAAYDALLQKWPVPYEALHIPTLYGSTHVIASGSVDAPPLVLLHGLEATALVWRANVLDLSRHFLRWFPCHAAACLLNAQREALVRM